MPALTHGRVGTKNGGKDFNGGRRLNNATAGVKFSRTIGSSKSDALRSKAIVGGVGSQSKSVKSAINRKAVVSSKATCCKYVEKKQINK